MVVNRIARPRLAAVLAVVVAAGTTGSACAKWRADKNKPGGEAVAHVGSKAITAADFRATIAEQPAFSHARYKSLDRKKELLDIMVRQELLLAEARRRKLDQDPEVKATIDRVLVQKLTRVYTDEQARAPEADLRRYYDEHKAEFVTPTRVRVAHLFLAAPEKDPKRAQAVAEANRLLKEAKAKDAKGEKQALEMLASQRSEDAATKATGGDLGFKTREELAAAWGSELANAALSLKTVNEIGPVVATSKGVHVIRLLSRHDGYETSFEAARSRIEARLSVERRTRSIDELVADLRTKTKVEIDEKALSAVDVSSAEDRPSAAPRSEPALGLR